MLDYETHVAEAERQEATAHLASPGDQEALAQDAQDQRQAALEEEPWFPSVQDAEEANQAGLEFYGHPLAGTRTLNEPGFLESALNAPKQHWYYATDEQPDDRQRLIEAAAKLGYHVAQAQAFTDGNKRAARALTQTFLHNNGLGHISPLDQEDEEYADHLVGYGTQGQAQQPTHSLEDTISMFKNRDMGLRQSNILDPIHDTLDPLVWLDPAAAEPTLRPEHKRWIEETINSTLSQNGYDGMEKWLSLVFTGSLTTYQYSDDSDVDVSLFVDTQVFPEWSRAEMIGTMVGNVDGTKLPGTPHVMQCFVVAQGIEKTDLYKEGLRSGYDLATDSWLVPPDRSRVHDVEHEMNQAYTIALENADKMERLLRYEPDKAIQFWHQIHKRRQQDMRKGRGDYTASNVTYKMLANRGLFPEISDVSGEYIAKTAQYEQYLNQIAQAYNAAPTYDPQAEGAWHELAQDSAQRANEIRNRLNVSVTDESEPYSDAPAMLNDINRGNFVVSRANSEHPIWTPEQNVDFRIVHDVLGHGTSGGDFSWAGENKACGAHSPLLTPNAQRALFTECIAQTAAANHNGGFGPQKTAFLDHAVPKLGTIPEGGFCHRHIRHGF